MTDEIKLHEYNLREFIGIATRYSINGLFKSRTKELMYPIVGHNLQNARQLYETFRTSLQKEFDNPINGKGFEIDIKDRFLPMISIYNKWYKKNSAEFEKFEPYNFYKLMYGIMESTEHEINKYFKLDSKSNTSVKQISNQAVNHEKTIVKDIPHSLSFQKENCKIHILNWNNENDNNLTKWIKSGEMIEVEKCLFVRQDIMNDKKRSVDNLFGLIDMVAINLSEIYDEVKFICDNKAAGIENMLDSFFAKSNDIHVNLPFYSLCPKIIKQPLYLIEAYDKYPNSLTEEKKIYYRYKYLNAKIEFGKDKFLEYRKELSRIIRVDISNENKKLVKSVFLFMEQFIEDLSSLHRTQFNYFESPLFKLLFEEIMKFKGYYIATFDRFTFENILKIEKLLKKNKTDSESDSIHLSSENQNKSMVEKQILNNDSKEYLRITKGPDEMYVLRSNNHDNRKITAILSGFCIYFLWKSQQAENANAIFNEYPKSWIDSKDVIFEEYYDHIHNNKSKSSPLHQIFPLNDFIKSQIHLEKESLNKLVNLPNYSPTYNVESVKTWTADYLLWLNNKLTNIDDDNKTILSSTSKEYEKLYGKLLSNFLYDCEATELDYINEVLEYWENTLHDIKNSESSHDGHSLTGIQNFTDAYEVVELIGYKKFHYATKNKIEFLENRKRALASGDISNDDESRGFNSNLSDEQIETLFKKMKSKFIDEKTDINYFTAIFSTEELPSNFKKIKWVDTTTRKDRGKHSNKSSLGAFLNFTMVLKSINPDQTIVNNCFSDIHDKDLIIGNLKNDAYFKRKINKFKEMIQN